MTVIHSYFYIRLILCWPEHC